METWFVVVVSLCMAGIIGSVAFRRKKLPPGPSFLSSNLLLLTNSRVRPGDLLGNLKSKYGPLITLSIGFRPSIFVSDHSLAHRILIQKGAIFSDRPKTIPQRNISTATYGPTWRLLRRNLASELLHPSCVKSYSWARKWMLHVLIGRLQVAEKAGAGSGIQVIEHFQFAMLSLLVLMCFGEKLDERKIDEITRVQRDMLLVFGSGRFTVLAAFPKLGKILFRNRWNEFRKMVEDKERVLFPLIKSRIEASKSVPQLGTVAYVDTLVNLRLPEEETTTNGGKLTDKEMVSMCSEFLTAGIDATSTALQWIMANLVKHPHIQSKLYDEIVSVVGPPPPPGEQPESTINEDDLRKMAYLKAVVLEGLRRHPPSHFLLLPHRVTKEVEVEGYVIPEGATVNFFVAEMGRDPKVWDDPMEFKPERFLLIDGFDLTGSKGIKMMPFGAGRRICPGSDLALLHLEYFVANLIWFFQWNAVDGYGVDLSEKVEFSVVMKNPLRTQITSRAEKRNI
ncbi:hypothetical protein OSB04_009178 [Centaurea solstitialis]|uniref:Cytochrome P450 n=1 Tax=Centaurea solstitialis TaxID=347529 RepID=A0AA38TVP1_9ASTR|nr:hypothetical protein OSB04_009178 [Centaurea solstitialis]